MIFGQATKGIKALAFICTWAAATAQKQQHSNPRDFLAERARIEYNASMRRKAVMRSNLTGCQWTCNILVIVF